LLKPHLRQRYSNWLVTGAIFAVAVVRETAPVVGGTETGTTAQSPAHAMPTEGAYCLSPRDLPGAGYSRHGRRISGQETGCVRLATLTTLRQERLASSATTQSLEARRLDSAWARVRTALAIPHLRLTQLHDNRCRHASVITASALEIEATATTVTVIVTETGIEIAASVTATGTGATGTEIETGTVIGSGIEIELETVIGSGTEIETGAIVIVIVIATETGTEIAGIVTENGKPLAAERRAVGVDHQSHREPAISLLAPNNLVTMAPRRRLLLPPPRPVTMYPLLAASSQLKAPNR